MSVSKPFYLSKIFWVNIAATIALLLDVFKVLPIPPVYLVYGGVVVASLNVIIRVWFSDQPLTLK